MLLKIGFYLIYRFVLYFLAFNSKPDDAAYSRVRQAAVSRIFA